ncbi:glycosyltransferase family 2 protein [Haloferula sp. BvORR071]|uniref:glycosyltransferase family 2 protein n=1 Tax=Haloferula sp. BvORR071 TaxID=1396141 RepID=UPI00054D5147|nr:glycosyltransferase family 2 protein [Haloferula sp. BvORR071]
MFSLLILTKNEEANLPACIASAPWCDDIVVLDSFSDDSTKEIAIRHGARFFERKFDDFGAQRNHALDNIPFKHPWVFHLDADERFNEELREECEQVIARDEHSAYFVPNRIFFLGKWIPRSTQYPYPQVRLLKIGEVSFVKSGHGQREDRAARGIGHISIGYDHFNFSKGLGEWVEKHNRYSAEEAAAAFKFAKEPLALAGLWSGDPMERKRALKRLHSRLPLRWMFKFAYLYFWKRGFLDGYPGFAYCSLQAFYDLLITLKIQEMSKSPAPSRSGVTAADGNTALEG